MTVTIRPENGTRLGDLVHLLVELAGGDKAQVRSAGGGGLHVSHDLAARYFATRGAPMSTDADLPSTPADDLPATPVPANLGRVVTQAENRGGLTRRRDPAKTTETRARSRAATAGSPASTEEHTHG